MPDRTPVRHRLDEAALVWAAALAADVDPQTVLDQVDLPALTRVVAEVERIDEVVDAAAHLLVEVLRQRTFARSNSAAGWLGLVHLLDCNGLSLEVSADEVVAICAQVRAGTLDRPGVAGCLQGWVRRPGLACPACERRVYIPDPTQRPVPLPGRSAYELTARCAFEHGDHDRHGRSLGAPGDEQGDSLQPVIARGDCGSFLVVARGRCLVISPYCDDPPIHVVVEVGEVSPSSLVGRWDTLVERSPTLGYVPTSEIQVDAATGQVDVDRLHAAIDETTPGPRAQLVGA